MQGVQLRHLLPRLGTLEASVLVECLHELPGSCTIVTICLFSHEIIADIASVHSCSTRSSSVPSAESCYVTTT